MGLNDFVNKLIAKNDAEANGVRSQVTHDDLVGNAFDEIMVYTQSEFVAAQLARQSRGMLSKDVILADIRDHIKPIVKSGDDIIDEALQLFEDYEWGYFILKPWIDQRDITDIHVLAWDKIFYKLSSGERVKVDKVFRDANEYNKFIELIVTRHNKSISNSNAVSMMTDESDPNWYLRIDIATSYLNYAKVTKMHIRKHPKKKYTIEDLVANGTIPQEQMDYIVDKVKNLESFLICGSNGKGKTTFVNAIIDALPADASIMCLQESNEIHMSDDRQFVALHPVAKTSSGGIEYTKSDLTKLGLVSDVDVFINGEITGEDALDFLLLAHNGATCYATVHSESMDDAFIRIADYAKRKIDYTASEIQYMIRHMQNVVLIENKKVKAIGKAKWDGQKKVVTVEVVYENEI